MFRIYMCNSIKPLSNLKTIENYSLRKLNNIFMYLVGLICNIETEIKSD